jgi:DNA-directed RNA polymerase subunit RPC12/RpoP
MTGPLLIWVRVFGEVASGKEFVKARIRRVMDMNHCQALQFIEDIKMYMKIPYKIAQLKTAMENVEKGYKCSFCDKVYTIAANRRRHELQTHINNDDRFSCTICGSEYRSRDSLARHLKNCVALK